MLKFVSAFVWLHHINRKFVTTKKPLCPLFPFVSSTLLMESISNSPRLDLNKDGNKDEPMVDAAKDAKEKKKTMNEAFFHPRHQELFENLKNKWCK